MNEIITTIISLCEKLTEEEKISITNAFSRHFGRRIQSLIPELSTFNQDELAVIRKVINGLILTKENVPDILESYERLKDTDLPQKVSFGRMTEN